MSLFAISGKDSESDSFSFCGCLLDDREVMFGKLEFGPKHNILVKWLPNAVDKVMMVPSQDKFI